MTARRIYVGLVVLAFMFAGVRSSLAAGEDLSVLATVQQVMSDDYPTAGFGEAKRKLTEALEKCKRGRCSAATRSQVLVSLGMVMSQLGSGDEARAQFAAALQANPNARLPVSGTTPNIRAQFADAQKTVGVSAPPPPPPQPTVVASPAPPPPPPADNTPAEPAPTRPLKIRGWNSPEAFEYASEGLKADLAGKLDECISKDKKSLELEEQPRTRLHLASCERRSGHVIDSLRDTQKALEDAIRHRDVPVMRAARERVQELLARVAHVTFVPPAGVTDLTVTFDDRPVPTNALTRKFSIDPGKHTVHAEGTEAGLPVAFDDTYDVKDGDLLTVTIRMQSKGSEYLTPGQLKCMLGAKSQDEVVKCLPQHEKNLVVKAGWDFSAYTDTNSVNVVTPSLNATVESPTAGWNIGGTFLLDVVTAASPDIVSEASPAFRDRRWSGGLTGGYKKCKYGVQANGNASIENDYDSFSGGVAFTADLRDKLLTPRLSYNYDHDIIGRTGTPFSIFSHQLDTHQFDGGLTMVLSSTTLLSLDVTAQFERGDQSKPYRYIPMFTHDNALAVQPGESIDIVNQFRLPVRPLEQLPTSRDRFALGIRLAKRFSSRNATLRLDQRLYYDDWGIASTTTDGRWVQDVGKYFRFWPHLRVNAQTGASFYHLAYAALLNGDGSITVPLYRSDDRELGPLITLTGGGGFRLALTAPDAKTQVGFNFALDIMYTRFFAALFVTTRTAAYGTAGMDFEFD